MLNITIS